MTLLSKKTYEEVAPLTWFQEIRQKAKARFEKIGFPSNDSETWKYINLSTILKTDLNPNTSREGKAELPSKETLEKYFLAEGMSVRLVFSNGKFSKELSHFPELPKGVIIENLKDALTNHPDLVKRYLAKGIDEEADGFAAMNTLNFEEGVFVYVPEGIRLSFPVQILLLTSEVSKTLPSVFYPRLLVVLEKKAGAELLFESVGLENMAYLVNSVSEIFIGEGAFLNQVKLWEESQTSFHLDKTSVNLEKEGRFELQSFTQSGKIIRSEIETHLRGERTFVSLQGLSLLSGESQLYQVAAAHHHASHTESRQLYKNILGGQARSEFNSLVYVYRDAQKSDSSQLNKNLLLSDTARAFTRPQLKIYADDVKCHHGATVGQLDKEGLFYLRSRGIPKVKARTLITYGFAKELIHVRWLPSLQKRLEKSFKARLEKILGDAGE